MTDPVDIVHLTFLPPFATGSYNRFVGAQMEKLTEFRQAAISYWAAPQPETAWRADDTILVNGDGLSWGRELFLRLPERIRQRYYYSIGGREHLIYTWRVVELVAKLRPKIIVCYDGYKLGRPLRDAIDWPCRIILGQCGLTYNQPQLDAMRVYSLQSFDVVWTQTRISYRYDRDRLVLYEPMVMVLPNGVDASQYQPVSPTEKASVRAEWELPQDKLVILLLSRQVPKKGTHLIVQSWPKIVHEVPEAYLWIVGTADLEYERYIKGLIDRLELSNSVRLQGAVTPEKTAGCYQAADLYVFPTLAGEGMSNTLLEAMACGLACVASEHASARELYSDEEVLFVPDANIGDAFVRPIVRLLCDSSLRRRIGEAARTAVEQRYSQDIIFDQLRECYRQQMGLVSG
ncbi:MAG: glycosyltransferase family 4 protein [Acidobacteria bacterium]|nr:glycosyltransferase family 4 protein [Acidobacteriota bacterium]